MVNFLFKSFQFLSFVENIISSLKNIARGKKNRRREDEKLLERDSMTRKTTKQHIFRHILNAIFTFNLSSSAVVCWGNNNKKHSKEIKFEVLGLRLLCVPGRERESNEGEIGEIHISLGFNRVRRVLRTFLVKKRESDLFICCSASRHVKS